MDIDLSDMDAHFGGSKSKGVDLSDMDSFFSKKPSAFDNLMKSSINVYIPQTNQSEDTKTTTQQKFAKESEHQEMGGTSRAFKEAKKANKYGMPTEQEVQAKQQEFANLESKLGDAPIETSTEEVIPGLGFLPKGGKELAYLGDAVKSGAIGKDVLLRHAPLLKEVEAGNVAPKVADNIIKADPEVAQAIKNKSFTDIVAENINKPERAEPQIADLIDQKLIDMGHEPHFKTAEEIKPTEATPPKELDISDFEPKAKNVAEEQPLYSKGEIPKTIKQLEAENRTTVPKVPVEKVFKNKQEILPTDERIAIDKHIENNGIESLPIKEVNINDIVPTQKNITIKNLQSVKGKNIPIEDSITAIEKDGKYYITDGHHRVSNDILEGKQSIPMRVLNQYKPLTSKGAQGSTTTEAIHQSAKKLLGKNYDNLKGDINIVQSYKDLPKGLVDNGVEFSSGGKVRGIFNPKDGKVHLIADTMSEKETPSVLVHELLHKAKYSGQKVLGESHDTFVLRLKQLKDETIVRQAMQAAKDAGTSPKHMNDEIMSYLVEKYQLGKDMSPKVKRFVSDVIDAVKVFASKTAVKLGVDAKWLISKMNEKDIAALLKSSAIKQEVKSVSKEQAPMMSISNDIKNAPQVTKSKELIKNSVDKVTETLQDYWKPVEKYLNTSDLGKRVNDARKNIYGRTGERIAQVRDTQQSIVNDIVKYAKHSGEDTETLRKDLNSFLIAQHAPERNEAIRDSAAGISTEQAIKSLQTLKETNPTKYKLLDTWANKVRSLNEQTLDILKDGQVITPELYDTLRAKYKMHVPLQRIMPEEKEAIGGITGGKGFSVKSSGLKAAKGSDLEVSDILGNVSANVQEAIIRAEKNRVGLAMYDLFKADKSLGEARGLKMVGKDLKDMPIMETPNENSIVLFKDGKKKIIIPNDPIIAKVYNQLNVEDKGLVARVIAPITRTIAGLYTRFNPEFALSNVVRDLQESFVYNAAEMSGKDAIGAVGNQAFGMKGVADHIAGKDTEASKLYEQMKLDGGTTGGVTLSNRAKITQDVDDMFKIAQSNPRKAFESVFKSIDHFNSVFEDGTRLAAYKQALDKGLSRDQAAVIAKETTIDFNRKGTATPWLNAVYMFSNASIQGSYKMLKAFKNPKVLAGTVGTIVAISAAVDSHNDTVDPDWRDKVNDFERTSNYVILLDSKDGNLRRIDIPIGWGFKPIKTMVESMRDVAVGKTIGSPVARVFGSIASGYNPLGGNDLLANLTPTIADVAVDIKRNVNWKGQMISPKGMELAKPSEQYFPTTPETLGGRLAIKLVEGTEKIGIDLTPEDVKYIFSSYGGGPANFSTGIYKMLESASTGKDINPEDVVMARRFYKVTAPERLAGYEGKQSIKKMIEKVQQAETPQDRIKLIQEELPKIDEKDRAKAVSALKYGGLLPSKKGMVKQSEKAKWEENILNPFQSSLNTKK